MSKEKKLCKCDQNLLDRKNKVLEECREQFGEPIGSKLPAETLDELEQLKVIKNAKFNTPHNHTNNCEGLIDAIGYMENFLLEIFLTELENRKGKSTEAVIEDTNPSESVRAECGTSRSLAKAAAQGGRSHEKTCGSPCKGLKERINLPIHFVHPEEIRNSQRKTGGYTSAGAVPVPGLWPQSVLKRRKYHRETKQGDFLREVSTMKWTYWGITVVAFLNHDKSTSNIEHYDIWRCYNSWPIMNEFIQRWRNWNNNQDFFKKISGKDLENWMRVMGEHYEHIGLKKVLPRNVEDRPLTRQDIFDIGTVKKRKQ